MKPGYFALHFPCCRVRSQRVYLALVYGCAVLFPGLMLLLRQNLPVAFSQRPLLILFMFPVTLCALLGGLGPGLLATAMVAVFTAYYFIPPYHQFAFLSNLDAVQWGMLLANGVLVSLLSEALHRSRRHMSASGREISSIQHQLQQSELSSLATFEQAAVGIALLAPDGHWLRVNRRLCEILGYSSAELLQLTFQQITHPQDLDADELLVHEMLVGARQSYSMEKRYIRKDGAVVWANLTVALVWTTAGEPDYFISTVEDINRRKQAEEALKNNEATLQEAQRLAQIGNWRWNILLDQHYWSAEVYRIYGRDPALPAAVYPEVAQYFSPESWQQLSVAVEHCLHSGEPYECDAEVLLSDGSSRWITARGAVTRQADGTMEEMHGTIQDITARKQVELALAQSQGEALENQRRARLAALNLMEDALLARARVEEINTALRDSEQRSLMAQEGAHVGIWSWDLGARKVYLSPQCARLFDLASDGLVRYGEILRRIHPEDLVPARQQMKVCSARGESFEVEFRVAAPGVPLRWLSNKGQAQRDASGKIVRLSGICLDISERVHAQQRVRQLSLAVEQSPEGIVITDVEGRIEYANESFVRTSGYDPLAILGKNASILQSGLMPRESFSGLKRALAEGERWQGEFVNRRENGEIYYVFATISPIRQNGGKITHYVAAQEDITEKKRLDHELERYRYHLEEMVTERTAQLAEAQERAEAANHAKSAFLANMSHEIRTPMNAILGLTHLMRRDGVTEAQAERLDKVATAGQHLLSIINDVLDLSKIEAGRLELLREDFSLQAMFSNVCNLINDTACAKGLAVAVDISGVPAWMCGDITRLRQALLNYAGNAVKFTEQGTITLRARLLQQKNDWFYVRFEVQDSGIGISAEQRQQLFQMFQQADISTTRKYGGTGLGLAINQRLAELMGGEVGVDDAPGGGCIFWFTAQLARGRAALAPPSGSLIVSSAARLRATCQGMRLLLVEDNEVNREVVLELLHDSGLILDTAENGQVALDKVQLQDYDLILMDIQMPVMDGLEATRAIRALARWGGKPILALTASAFEDDRRACERAGMNDFVTKPVSPEELFSVLLKWLALNTPEDHASVQDQAKMVAATAQPAGDDEDAMAVLSAIPGLDIEHGLQLLRGRSNRYLDLLRRFVSAHASDMDKLEASFVHADQAQSRLIVHSLKGVAAMLGALHLSGQALALEQALMSDPEASLASLTPLMMAINSEFSRLQQGLQLQIEVVVSAPEPASCSALQRQQLTELLDLLLQNDTAALEWLEQHGEALSPVLAVQASVLQHQVQSFNFETAAQILRTFLATFPDA
jgi:two-component system sensor histidine kinase/response regulator